MKICSIRDKEVINVNNCRILGYVDDVDFDVCTGCVVAIIVPGPAKICNILGRDSEYVIPFKCVVKIGPDAILVDVCEEKVLQKCF